MMLSITAFIRFQVRGEFGYFLFDPGFALNKPLILMIKSIDDTMGIGVKRCKFPRLQATKSINHIEHLSLSQAFK